MSMVRMPQRVPAARSLGLVTTETMGEVLVYDQERHAIHRLTPAAAVIWRTCDGQRSRAEIAMISGASPAVVDAVLDRLHAATLLDGELIANGPASSGSRRAFLRKAGIAGAVPFVVSVTAPSAAQAESCDLDDTACDPQEAVNNCCSRICCERGIEVITGYCCSPRTR